jgi:arylsulfatase A-like enzyme
MRSRVAGVLSALLFIVLPSVFTGIRQHQSLAAGFFAWADNLLMFTVLVTCQVIAARLPRSKAGGAALSAVFAGYYLLMESLILYWQIVGHQFDLLFALDSYGDVYRTLANTLGPWLPVAGAGLLVLYALDFVLLWVLFLRIRTAQSRLFASWTIIVPLALQCACLVLNRGEQRLVFEEFGSMVQVLRDRAALAPLFPDNSAFTTSSQDGLFLLQLESGNAIAVGGKLVLDGKAYSDDYMPEMRAIARDGVLFPFFWSNSVQSNRALLNVLCGVTNNVSRALSYNPEKIQGPCLPEILRRAGYHTVFFLGFSSWDFMNYGNLVKSLGFDEVHNSLLAGGESEDEWGVDDCRFYHAMFDYLRTHHSPEKLFVYAEVSAHHFPFPGKWEYAPVHKFQLPQNFTEWYLNSFLEQDRCLRDFYGEFQRYAGEHAHLFIYPDHSWPVGMHGNTSNDAFSYNENFLIPFLYVPPRSRRAEFKVGQSVDARHSLTDVIPTVFDLLNDRPYPNSFAFDLRSASAGPHDYEDCHILVQPYGGGEIVIVKGWEKYVYYVSEKRLVYYDLASDWAEQSPRLIAREIPYSEVRSRFYCERYKRAIGNTERDRAKSESVRK